MLERDGNHLRRKKLIQLTDDISESEVSTAATLSTDKAEDVYTQAERHAASLGCGSISERYMACESLARLGTHARGAIPSLLIVAHGDENTLVRKSAVYALGDIAIPHFVLSFGKYCIRFGKHCAAAVEHLQRIAESDEDKFVRQGAEHALRRLQDCERWHSNACLAGCYAGLEGIIACFGRQVAPAYDRV